LEGHRSKAYAVEELRLFQKNLEEFLGHKISDQSTNKSIEVYNFNRNLLRDLYDLRRNRPGTIKASEILAIVMSSMFIAKEEHSQMLSQLLPELRQRQTVNNGIKLVLSGSLCLCPDVKLLDLIEDLGGMVVDDDLYVGSRYFATDVAVENDPIGALVDAYLNMVPCPTRLNRLDNNWGDYLSGIVRTSQARGVITLLPKYCEPHSFYIPYLAKRLSAEGVSHLTLETIPDMAGNLGQLRTRVQTFLEILGGN
jgi:benzoyl-CoA reductase/2-hydroxyglutaryl-CoA dehydratase subunit BcrC/BadD/HgdB